MAFKLKMLKHVVNLGFRLKDFEIFYSKLWCLTYLVFIMPWHSNRFPAYTFCLPTPQRSLIDPRTCFPTRVSYGISLQTRVPYEITLSTMRSYEISLQAMVSNKIPCLTLVFYEISLPPRVCFKISFPTKVSNESRFQLGCPTIFCFQLGCPLQFHFASLHEREYSLSWLGQRNFASIFSWKWKLLPAKWLYFFI